MSLTGLKSVFENLKESDKEIIETLFENGNVRIERIISNGDKSPEDFWYDQDEYEFVLLVQGDATLRFEDSDSIALKKGNWLIIEPHERHRVEKTSKDAIWICVFFR